MGIRRELGRTLGLFSMPMMLGGCSFVFGLALCQSVCGDEDPVDTNLVLSIVSPAQNTSFDDEAITVGVEVLNNVDGVTVTLGAGTAATQIHLDPGESEGTLTITPASDSGYIFLVAGAFSDAAPTTLASEGRIGILWSAPWLAGPIGSCTLAGDCAPLADDATLSREAHLGGAPRWDNARLARVDLTLDGVAPEDLNLLNEDWWFDTEIYDDGEVTLSVTVVRDDGLEANVTRQISIANCPRARPDAQYYLAAYAADGNLTTGAGEITWYDLHDGSSSGTPVVNGVATALALDEVNDVTYFGVDASTYHRLDYYNFAGLATVGGVSTPILALAVGSDGYVYWSEGVRGATPAGAIWRKHPQLIAAHARVDVGGLPGADGLVFDADGTLLVAAGDTIHRLTLTDGVETARASVYTRSGATFTQIARDDQGRIYVTDKTAGELIRYTAGADEVLYTQPDWATGGTHEPWSLSFVEYPPRCHGLLVTRHGLDDARRMVDVGPVRGTP